MCQWVIIFMPSIMALVPSFGVRPEGPVTRSGFQRPDPGREGIDVGQLAIVIDVQVGDEDVVDHLHRNLQATILRRQPGPRSKKKRFPLPSSTMIAVPACARVGGTGELPINEMRISSAPSSSIPGKNVFAFATDGVGR